MRDILLSLIMICSFAANSQQLYFNHLSVNNGLSQGVNNCIYKDSKGFVWISSFDGLNRFDGIACEKYYAAAGAADGIKGTLFLNIMEDRSANMWIGSNEGLNFYNRKTGRFHCYKTATNVAEQFCSPFYIDDANRVWLQSGTDIFIFDQAQKEFTKLNTVLTGSNVNVRVFPQQLYQPVQTLIATSNAAPVMYKGSVSANKISWQSFVLPIDGAVINNLQMFNNSCWIGTSNGLYCCAINDPADCRNLLSLQSQNISSLHIDNTGTIWAGTLKNGLVKADSSGNIQQQFISSTDNDYSLSGNQVNYINTDNNRNLWVSVWGKGVDYTNLDKFHFNQYISKTEALKAGTDNFLRSIVTVNNEVWCATQSGGIIVLDTGKKIKQVIKEALPSTIEYLCVDGNIVWAATFAGLFSIDAASKKVSKVVSTNFERHHPAASQYNYICRLQDGSLLLSSNAGLYRATKNKAGLDIVLLKGVNAADVYLTTYQHSNGDIFISKAFKGFGKYQLHGDSLYTLNRFSLQATVKCFIKTSDSLLWIGTTVGLIKFNTTTSSINHIYTSSDGLSNQYIYGIVPQGQYLWLSTNAGINRFAVADGSVKTFSAADGLQSNEYNTYSFCKPADGEILFGGVNGLNSFDPQLLRPFKSAPALVLSSVMVEDSLYPVDLNYDELTRLEVSYKQNTLAFQFTVIDYVNAPVAHTSYMLEGYDKSWVNAPNKSFIRYANLPPGNYILKVRAFNADGVMGEKVFEMPVSVLPAWWQTWWFGLLVTASIILLTVVFVKNYLRAKLQKQKMEMEKELAVEQERIRMARELHDGLGSMLSGIKHSFSAIKNEVVLNTEQEYKFGYTIGKLDDSIKDLRAVSHGMFSAELLEEGLVAAIKNYCNATSVTAKIHIAFESIMEQAPGLSGEQAFHVFRVVQELVQNIVKHSGAAEAMVQLSYNNGMLALTVEDSGTGFDTKQVHEKEGIGLRNVEARVKMLHGKTDIRSIPGKGTSILVEIPVG
jgi:signal transduction histidine kinase/ligand-binding sensor domain-containing protein